MIDSFWTSVLDNTLDKLQQRPVILGFSVSKLCSSFLSVGLFFELDLHTIRDIVIELD